VTDSTAPQPRTDRDSLLTPADNRRMFDAIARRYDLMNAVLSLGLDRVWRRRAVSELCPRPGGAYLDIGCGTGDVGVEIVRRCPTARVVGLDPAERMLDVGRSKIAAANLDASITFCVGDATALPFGDAEFAGIVTAFCIRNVADRQAAMREMRRTLAPGGRVVILELSVPASRLLAVGHRCYNRYVVPLAGRIIARSRTAYQYLVDSVANFPRPPQVLDMLTRAGFETATARPIHGGIVTIFTAK